MSSLTYTMQLSYGCNLTALCSALRTVIYITVWLRTNSQTEQLLPVQPAGTRLSYHGTVSVAHPDKLKLLVKESTWL